MNDEKGRVAGLFDRASATYDALGIDFFSVFGSWLVEAADLAPGDRVLDVGCGRGASLRPAAEAVGPSGRAVGLDLAPGMVTATARDLAHLDHVLVALADAEHPPAAAAAYDAVLAGLVVFFLPDPLGAVRRWARALRPEGRLVVSTFGADDERWTPVLACFDELVPGDLRPRPAGEPPWRSDTGMAALLADAGLPGARSWVRPFTAVFPAPADWVRWSQSHGARAGWEAVPAERHAALTTALLQELAALRDPDGACRLQVGLRVTLARRP